MRFSAHARVDDLLNRFEAEIGLELKSTIKVNDFKLKLEVLVLKFKLIMVTQECFIFKVQHLKEVDFCYKTI